MALPTLEGVDPVMRESVEQLMACSEGEHSLFDRLYGIYKDESRSLLPEVKDALDAKDSEKAYQAVHKLKGSAGAIGAQRVHEFTRGAMEMCEDRSIFHEDDFYDRLVEEVDLFDKEIEQMNEA